MRPIDYIKRFGPRVFDTRLIAGLCLATGVGVFLIVWNAQTLRLEVDGHLFVWLPLVTFGIVWSAGRDVAWRTAAGALFGAMLAVTALWSGMGFLPVAWTMAWAVWIGAAIAIGAAVCHLLPRLLSFGAMAIGFGAGMGASLLAAFDPTTSAIGYLNVLLTVVLAFVIGTLAAQGLHAVIVALDGVYIGHHTPKQVHYRAAPPSTPRRAKPGHTKKAS